jgi:flagellum-specific peptidoglycan hydrolase FlgJ
MKRYEIVDDMETERYTARESPEGDFVFYSDVAELEHQLAELTKKVAELTEERDIARAAEDAWSDDYQKLVARFTASERNLRRAKLEAECERNDLSCEIGRMKRLHEDDGQWPLFEMPKDVQRPVQAEHEIQRTMVESVVEKVRARLESKEGQRELREIIEKSKEFVKRMKESSRVDPAILREPMTF